MAKKVGFKDSKKGDFSKQMRFRKKSTIGLKKNKTDGSVKDKPPNRPWRKLNPDALSKCVEEHSEWTLKEYAQHFNTIPSTICEAFKRLQIIVD